MTLTNMKQLFFAAICLGCFSLNIFAQTSETFDISTFQSPKGWTKQAGVDGIQFSIEDKGSFALVTLFKSVPGIGEPKKNFDAAWSTIVKEAVTVTAAPQMFPADSKGEWIITGGFAPFEKDGEKGVPALYTATGYGNEAGYPPVGSHQGIGRMEYFNLAGHPAVAAKSGRSHSR